MPERCAVYPGSFDPITNGHLNIIERSCKIFDKLIVTVAHNAAKAPVFTLDERIDLVKKSVAHLNNVTVDTFDGLLVDYMTKIGINTVIRGLRAISDFEYEFQIAHINHRLGKEIDTLFMMTSEEYFYVSSSIVREVAMLGGNIKGLVPDPVEQSFKQKYSRLKQQAQK